MHHHQLASPHHTSVLGASVDGDAVDYIAAILDDEPLPSVEDLAEYVLTRIIGVVAHG